MFKKKIFGFVWGGAKQIAKDNTKQVAQCAIDLCYNASFRQTFKGEFSQGGFMQTLILLGGVV